MSTVPASAAALAIRLCPHACPNSGSASYSARIAITGRAVRSPQEATNAVGKSATPRAMAKPSASSASVIQAAA